MSDPILGSMAYPCGDCGADAGQDCTEGCPGSEAMDWSADEVTYFAFSEPELIDTRPMDESLSILSAAVHLLPYGNLVGIRGMGAPDRQDYSPEEYIERLADWMAEYQLILRREIDALQKQAVRLISLEMERDMVRNYLKGAPV